MTGKALRSSPTLAGSAATQLELDRKAVAARLVKPSIEAGSPATFGMGGLSFAEAVAAAKLRDSQSGMRAKPRPDDA
jgi:hypothetical protein